MIATIIQLGQFVFFGSILIFGLIVGGYWGLLLIAEFLKDLPKRKEYRK